MWPSFGRLPCCARLRCRRAHGDDARWPHSRDAGYEYDYADDHAHADDHADDDDRDDAGRRLRRRRLGRRFHGRRTEGVLS